MSRACWVALFLSLTTGCGDSQSSNDLGTSEVDAWPPALLSSFALFDGNLADLRPTDGVFAYDLNTPLFSDYTDKYRFIKLPNGGQIKYHDSEVFQFPVGSIIAKTFAYPHDLRDRGAGRRLLETRLLVHRSDGWVGLPYIWNTEQTEATLDVAGATIDCEWIHTDGQPRKNNYLVPNSNQCKLCHEADGNAKPMRPLGITAAQLNREFNYPDGRENQLDRLRRLKMLDNAPAATDVPRLVVWDDPSTGDVNARARAWLEINCAHCHNPIGPAKNSGLDLRVAARNPAHFGVFKSPVAAGRGTGNRLYDIIPGKPDESILLYRIASDQSQVMMPELGKRLIHTEGVELIRQWIAEMPTDLARTGNASQ
jgi:uncharacterized repeat protein (TIGR03806 family)